MGTEASEGRAAQGSGRRKEIPTLPAGFEGDSSPSRFLPWGPPRLGRQVLTRPAPHHHHATSTSQRLPAGEDKGTAGDHILPQA